MNTSLNTSSKKKLRSKTLRVGLVALAGYAYFSSDVNSSTPEEDIKRNLSNIDFDKSTHTIAAVVNTAKCGTGGMQNSLVQSFECKEQIPLYERTVWHPNCEKNNVHVIRTHFSEEGGDAIEHARKNIPDGEEAQCLIMSGIRNPRDWAISRFVERFKDDFCDGNVPYDELKQRFHEFLMENSIVQVSLLGAIPGLMKEFGTTLKDQMDILKKNKGYSLITNAGDGPYRGCELLFLQMEYHYRWKEIIEGQFPGISYAKNEKRQERCPNFADDYERIMAEYEFSDEEIEAIVAGEDSIREYLEVYGIGLKKEEVSDSEEEVEMTSKEKAVPMLRMGAAEAEVEFAIARKLPSTEEKESSSEYTSRLLKHEKMNAIDMIMKALE